MFFICVLYCWDYFADILVPLDNYVSRSTEHFLTCKEPDYQQSLFKMLSTVRLLPYLLFPFAVFSPRSSLSSPKIIFLQNEVDLRCWQMRNLRIATSSLRQNWLKPFCRIAEEEWINGWSLIFESVWKDLDERRRTIWRTCLWKWYNSWQVGWLSLSLVVKIFLNYLL